MHIYGELEKQSKNSWYFSKAAFKNILKTHSLYLKGFRKFTKKYIYFGAIKIWNPRIVFYRLPAIWRHICRWAIWSSQRSWFCGKIRKINLCSLFVYFNEDQEPKNTMSYVVEHGYKLQRQCPKKQLYLCLWDLWVNKETTNENTWTTGINQNCPGQMMIHDSLTYKFFFFFFHFSVGERLYFQLAS